ncbi:unnamed protein product [Protopolystoma xenopodis]|uniref:Uncharacterized protein n=1 Tax=Protopolystoma xenopodis TaxID=117903 RepID=A0A3S5BA41_9PLAT|nr:unnamed protein product [Protopolystoma xenopodis]
MGRESELAEQSTSSRSYQHLQRQSNRKSAACMIRKESGLPGNSHLLCEAVALVAMWPSGQRDKLTCCTVTVQLPLGVEGMKTKMVWPFVWSQSPFVV